MHLASLQRDLLQVQFHPLVGTSLSMSKPQDLPQVQSDQAVGLHGVLLTLSGDDASCVVTAGPTPSAVPSVIVTYFMYVETAGPAQVQSNKAVRPFTFYVR